jgi:serine/threonine-protein kinase
MAAALSAEGTDATGQNEPALPGVLDTISQSIGPVPRVLLRDTAPGETPGPIVRLDGNGAGSSIRYRIDGEIARGGMGAVLKGRDPDLGREVALKVLREDYRDDPTMVRRFVEEAQIGGQLQHPGVVPIYELGTMADRRPFFSMKLVKGHTFASLLNERMKDEGGRMNKSGNASGSSLIPHPSSLIVHPSSFLSIFEAVCQTVAYAHARGVIHRDLKPSNVMVGSFGEVQVMDWGLAKVLPRGGVVDDASAGKTSAETVIATSRSGGADSDLSCIGSVMGTPAYMAPEQARGEVNLLDERTDVFSLGSILCEILTGQPAFTGRNAGEIQRKATLGDTAESLTRLDSCGGDAELITLAKDCLAREREDRPRAASAVAERMTAYLASVQDRMRKAELTGVEERARRRLTTVVAASLLALTTAGGLGFSYWLQQRHDRAARFAQVLAEASALRDKARRDVDDPAAWRDALAALKRAEGQGPADQFADVRDEIQKGLDEAERDGRLRQTLVEIRANHEDVGPAGTDAAYATAFRAAELDLDALEPAELGRRLRRRREAVAVELSAFLDDWSAARHVARRPVAAWRKPLEVARLADPDPYRDRLRKTLLAEDRRRETGALKALAAAPEAADLPAPTAVLLGQALLINGQPEAAVALLRPAAVRHPDDVWVNYYLAWALEQLGTTAREEAVRYFTAARAIRPETAHELAHLLQRMGRGTEAASVFRDLTKRQPENARHLMCLAIAAMDDGRAAEAEALVEPAIAAYRETIRLKPDDFTDHMILANGLLRVKQDYTGAEAEYREVIRLRPDYAEAHCDLGFALANQGKMAEAFAPYREATRLKPDLFEAHLGMGRILCDFKRDYTGAETEFRQAIRLNPDHPDAHLGLGNALFRQEKLPEAVAAYGEATRLKPDLFAAHLSLGHVLLREGKLPEAVAAYQAAIRLQPDVAGTYVYLGLGLGSQGKWSEGMAAMREAIRLKPDLVDAHVGIGSILADVKHDYTGAEAEFRDAIRLKPDHPVAHSNLGEALRRQGKLPEAIAAYREAIRLQPDNAGTRFDLGKALAAQRRYEEALTELRTARERAGPDAAKRLPRIDQWIAEAEQMVALAGRLPAVLKGNDRPKDVAERLALGWMCYDTKRPAAAARFWAEALAAEPKLGDDRRALHRYNAACAAALAGTGQGTDDPMPDDAARARLRVKSLDWLRAERAAWAKVLEAGNEQVRAAVAQHLQHWQADPDLAGVRDRDAIEKLPAEERRAWEALWNDVDVLLKGAAKPGPIAPEPSGAAPAR